MPVYHDYGVGQSLLDGLSESDDRFEGMSFWGNDVAHSFCDLGLCSIDVIHVLQDIESMYGVSFPDDVTELASSPLTLIDLAVRLINERSVHY